MLVTLFDFAYIYKFYSNRKDICQRLKYIVRVEVTNDIFAIKFYAARDKKLDNKYNRILKMHNYTYIYDLCQHCPSHFTKIPTSFICDKWCSKFRFRI